PTSAQRFTLVSLPGLIGSFMRFPYTFAVPRFGGRNWTVVSALLLLIPTVSLVVLVRHPETPFWLMALAASTAGLGGGNFASSMANISFFYPGRKKGFALGLNAAGGNIGVSTVQLLVPIVIGIGAAKGSLRLENAGLMWLPLIVVSAIGAFLFMDNLSSARSNFGDQLVIARRQQTWVMSFLYIGTFGSFVGYSAASPLLLHPQLPGSTAAARRPSQRRWPSRAARLRRCSASVPRSARWAGSSSPGPWARRSPRPVAPPLRSARSSSATSSAWR